MIYAVTGQISAIVPYTVAGKSSVQMQVVFNGQGSVAISVPVVAAAPGGCHRGRRRTGGAHPHAADRMNRAEYRVALGLAGATALVLLAMVGVTVATGASQEVHEHVSADYVHALLAQAGPLRLLMGLDVAFLALYTAFFATLASILRRTQRGTLAADLVVLGIAAMVAVAVLDIVEDHHILALLRLAELAKVVDDGALAFQQTLSSTKFSLSYIALVAFGLAIPRTSRLGWLLAAFLVGGTLVEAVVDFAVPPATHAIVDGGRWIGFLAGFALAALWLNARRAEATA